MPAIWYRNGKDGKPEKIDTASVKDVGYLTNEYRLAFGCCPGQAAYAAGSRVWSGRAKDIYQETTNA